ncbi:hypothetical protein NONO_c59910 [Nocardia nova SH22a]|uniref:HNH nuclease domain-containing protein n=1 Tax=Nocardia nova SH22a TaxID=1415166 RepID=W5TND0_9NOCA|nr:HNH endonuclease signature motif containing protein [Nocardia nova]AHH20767.1 hypothetical protein NONO_c59910 [Nocardia nova SH22a]
MSVHPTPSNLAREFIRRAVPKPGPRKRRPRNTGAARSVIAMVRARASGRCERCAGPVPPDTDVHHRIPRGMGGSRNDSRINLPSNLVVLCSDCHRWIESYRTEAYVDGWLVHRTAEPNATPIESALHGLVLLDDSGGIAQIGGAP